MTGFANIPWTARLGLIVMAVYALAACLAPWIAPWGESEIVGSEFMPWSTSHPLGTDNLGRDMLSRMIWGARNTVGIAIVATCLAFGVGVSLGLSAAVLGGWIDLVLARVVDLMIAVPALIMTLLFLTIFGTSVINLILIIAFIDATRVFRVARAIGGDIVTLDFVEAARLRGDRLSDLVMHEVLPNATPPLMAEFGLRFCFVFLAIAGLSFLGLGIQPPTADWGSMVRENAILLTFGDPTPLLPAGAIALLTVAVNFVVDWQLHRASGLKD